MTVLEAPPLARRAAGLRRRVRRTGAAGAALLAPLLLLAGPAHAATAPTSYSFAQQFAVAEAGSQQGLAYADGVHYVGFDLGSGNGRVVAYDGAGTELRRTGVLPLGHTNEISVRSADGNLYVTNSSASVPVVDVLDMRQTPPAVVGKIPVSGMTHGAVVAVDNARDQLVMVTGPTGGPYSLVTLGMTGTVLQKLPIPDQGITQGLEVLGGQILLYTSLSNPARNQISVFSSTGTLLRVVPVPVAAEGEGLSTDPGTNRVWVGANTPNRVLAMSPAFVPVTSGSTRTVVVTPVADTVARQQTPTAAGGAATTLLADTEETAGVASRATSYLRFTVPGLAAGESIASATLSLQVTNGTANGPTLWRTDPAWSESALTWASGQPARSGTSPVGGFGSMGTGRVSAAVSGVATAGDVSLQLSPDSSDGVQFASRESTTATSRPRLVLTVVGP